MKIGACARRAVASAKGGPDDPKDQMVGRDQRRGVHHRRADRDPLLTEDRRPDGVRSLKIIGPYK